MKPAPPRACPGEKLLPYDSNVTLHFTRQPPNANLSARRPIAHYAWMKGKTVPMEEVRQRWGV